MPKPPKSGAARVSPPTVHLLRGHLVAATAVGLILALLGFIIPSENVAASRQPVEISLDLPFPETAPETAEAPEIPEVTEPEYLWKEETVRSGDNLTTLFKRISLGASDVYQVASARTHADELKRLRPGEKIAAGFDGQGNLAEVRYTRSRLESFHYIKEEQGFDGQKVTREPELVTAFRQADIENSLFLAGARAGLDQAVIMELANIFGWDIDFALDIRAGDGFAVLFQEKYLDGEKIGNGDILAAEFTNQGKTFSAVRFVEKDGTARYYAPDGTPMRKAFLRAPLDFTRISSNFNLRRRHPIHKMIRAHRGVDYAAPRGTPVYAAGDGRVIAAGYSKPNGNYVFIKHGQTYITKYLHLTKRLVRKGQSVKQKQTIGTVGSTGYATGPHLHYEFLVNGVHRNPRTVDLPKADPIPAALREHFVVQTEPHLERLASYRMTRLAKATN